MTTEGHAMTDEADDWGATPDELTLVNGGRVRLVVDEQVHLLRSPNMGQLRVYRTTLVELLEAASTLADESKDDLDAAKDGSADAVSRVLTQMGAVDGEDRLNGLVFGVWRQIVADLDSTGRKLPGDDDEMAPWLTNISLIVRVLGHWRADPQAPGR